MHDKNEINNAACHRYRFNFANYHQDILFEKGYLATTKKKNKKKKNKKGRNFKCFC